MRQSQSLNAFLKQLKNLKMNVNSKRKSIKDGFFTIKEIRRIENK